MKEISILEVFTFETQQIKKIFFTLIYLTIVSLTAVGCGASSSSSVPSSPVKTDASTSQSQTSETTNSLPVTSSGIKTVPAALYSGSTTSDITISGSLFGTKQGTVALTSYETGNEISFVRIKNWSQNSITISFSPSSTGIAAGEYRFKITLPGTTTSLYSSMFNVIQPNYPIINDFSFTTKPVLGKPLPNVIFQGRNLWSDQSLPPDFAIYASVDNGTPVLLQIKSYYSDSSGTQFVTAQNSSFLLKGKQLMFWAISNSKNSNRITSQLPSIGKIYALFVGINDYWYVTKLNYSVPDAAAMKQSLAESQLNNLWSGAEVTLLTDGAATKSNIFAAIDSISSKLTPEDCFFMFYSGHGTSANPDSGNPDTETYICPVDTFASAADCISSSELKQKLSAMPYDVQKILIFDSCYSGGFVGKSSDLTAKYITLKDTPEDVPDTGGFKSIGLSAGNVFFMTASKYSELSYESSSLGHGVLTYNLLQGLGASGSVFGGAILEGHDTITMKEAFNYAAARVSGQTPQFFTTVSGDDIPLKGSLYTSY